MRLKFYSSMLIGLAAALSAGPARATIVDTGEVAVVDGVLEIGQTGSGLRVVDGEADGVYDGAALGIGPDASGELRLQNGAAFSTSGALVVGQQGDGLVHVSGGSQLDSGTAQIGVPGPVLGTAAVIVEGPGSSWVNSGLLTMGDGRNNGSTTEIRLSDGAILSTDGADMVASFTPGATSFSITIEGPGTSWSNQGSLRLVGAPDFIVRDGAHVESTSTGIGDSGDPARVVVDGPGTVFRTGPLRLGGGGPEPGRDLLVTNGGQLESESATLFTQYLRVVHIDGVGSKWSIAGQLFFGGNVAGGGERIEVTNGGLLETGETSMRNGGGSGIVHLSGPGSRWENAGSLVFGGGDTELTGSVTIDTGARMSTGDMSVSCTNGVMNSCQLAVLGADSAFVGTGSLALGGNAAGPQLPGILRIEDHATADVAGTVRAWAPGTIHLDGATLTAPLVDLAGGRLEGRGHIDSDLLNSGWVAPDAGIDPLSVSGDYQQTGAGTLSILLSGSGVGEVSVLEVLGTSVLAGQLEVELAAGFTPQVGDAFEVLRYGGHLGEFESYVGLDLGGGVSLVPEYGPTSLVLRAVPEPATGSLVALGLVVLSVDRKRRDPRRRA